MTVSVFWSQICRATWRSTIVAAISRLGRRSRNAIRSEGAAGAPIFESHGGEPDERRYLRTVSRPEVDPSTSAEPLDGPPEDPAGA